jgi:hypothetical protein
LRVASPCTEVAVAIGATLCGQFVGADIALAADDFCGFVHLGVLVVVRVYTRRRRLIDLVSEASETLRGKCPSRVSLLGHGGTVYDAPYVQPVLAPVERMLRICDAYEPATGGTIP